MEEYLAVCRVDKKNIIDNYFHINYDDIELHLPMELKDLDVEVDLNPIGSDLPDRELLVTVASQSINI